MAGRKRSKGHEANKALAKAFHEYGVETRAGHPNGLWEMGKQYVSQGLTPRQAARLARASLSDREQVRALQRVCELKGGKRKVVQVPLPFETPPQAKRRLNPQAQRVKDGEVLRDAKGRIVSREFSEVLT